MSKTHPTNIAASVKTRLLNEARKSNRPFGQLLQYYAMERFLFRLASSKYSDSFLLKGALMLRALGAELSRPTMDIDLLGTISNDHATIRSFVECCAAMEQDDGLVFDTTDMAVENIVEGADYHGVRVRFLARLGPARVAMQIDIGFGDKVVPEPVWIELPEILNFGAPRLKACTAETAIAEKLHAAVTRETINSRMKDFYDMYMMGKHLEFSGEVLSEAVLATFESRSTAISTEAPKALTPGFASFPGKQEQWNAFIRKRQLDDPPEFADAISYLITFLLPVLKAIAKRESFEATWSEGGPWR